MKYAWRNACDGVGRCPGTQCSSACSEYNLKSRLQAYQLTDQALHIGAIARQRSPTHITIHFSKHGPPPTSHMLCKSMKPASMSTCRNRRAAELGSPRFEGSLARSSASRVWSLQLQASMLLCCLPTCRGIAAGLLLRPNVKKGGMIIQLQVHACSLAVSCGLSKCDRLGQR